MDTLKKLLVQDLLSLQAVSPNAAMTYGAVKGYASARVSDLVFSHPQANAFLPENKSDMAVNNHEQHAQYMESVFLDGADESVVDTIVWVYRTYTSHGFDLSYWPVQIDAWRIVLADLLPEEDYQCIAPYYDWLAGHHADFAELAGRTPSRWEPVTAKRGGL